MANQSATKSVTMSSDGEPVAGMPNNFKWSIKAQKSLLFNMMRTPPFGIHRHLNMCLLREKMCEELGYNISTMCIWKYLEKYWDIKTADALENAAFSISKKDFVLPEEYQKLIIEEKEKILKAQEKESLNDEISRRKLFSGPSKRTSKSNSMSSVDAKDSLSEKEGTSTLSENSSVKTSENGFEEIPSPRRSLRTNDKTEEKEPEDNSSNKRKLLRHKSDEPNKSNDLKLCNRKTNQSKDIEKNEKISKVKSQQKRKSRNVSESSLSSDNSKQPRNYKNNLIGLAVSDGSSRSVTPEIMRGKTSNRSLTPETIIRKSNLRSSDKDKKTKLAIERACIKLNHHIDLILPEIKIERLKTVPCDKHFTGFIESKTKHLILNKNEINNKVKGKTRGRVTADLSVVQQSPDVQPLGRRSCSNKSS